MRIKRPSKLAAGFIAGRPFVFSVPWIIDPGLPMPLGEVGYFAATAPRGLEARTARACPIPPRPIITLSVRELPQLVHLKLPSVADHSSLPAVRQRLPVCDEDAFVRAADLRQHRIDPGAGLIAVGALNDGDENCDNGLTLLVAQLLDHSLVLPQVIIAPAMPLRGMEA